MLPLLGEVVTDMSKGEKNLFLGKLLQGEQILPLERDEFVRYYFENRQDQNRKSPFIDTTPEQNRKFWYSFTDEFSRYMILRFRLSGTEGTRTAFYPGKEGGFTQEVTKNLYDLAYRITNDFEQERISQLIKKEEEAARADGDAERAKKAAHDRELLNAGKLKLVLVNGVEQYISEEEAKNAATSQDENIRRMKVTPAVGVGLGKMKDPGIYSSAVQEETAGFDELQNDFVTSSAAATDQKYEKLVTAMADNGLDIVPNTFKNPQGQWNIDEKGFLNGEVKDRRGQRMKVKINPALGEKDPDKFEFTFIGGTAPNGSPLDGLSFTASEADLDNFKEKNAFDVALPKLPDRAKEKQGEPLPSERPGLPGGPLNLGFGKPKFEGAPGGPPQVSGEVGLPPPSVGIPTGAKAGERRPVPGAVQPGIEEMQPGGPISGRAPVSGFQKPKVGPRPVPRATLAARKRETERMREGMRAPLPEAVRPPSAGATAAPAQKKKVPWGAIAAIGTTTGAEAALVGATAAQTAAEDPTTTQTQETALLNMVASTADTITHALPHTLAHAMNLTHTAHTIADALPYMLAHLPSLSLAQTVIHALAAHITGGSFFV